MSKTDMVNKLKDFKKIYNLEIIGTSSQFTQEELTYIEEMICTFMDFQKNKYLTVSLTIEESNQ
jgi:hypothetical protein